MVIKILKSGTTFSGVVYSDEKEELNKAQLMSATNFPFLDNTTQELVDHLEEISSLNPRVKNKQFHVSISTKGQEHSFKELEQVAKQYLEHMGYGKNPYLIYSHHDSPNNHIHIVSTRIDPEGKKISDSLEKVRTQSFIENKLHVNFSKDVNKIIRQSLNFNFKNIEALQSLFKKQGYATRIKEGNLEVIKSGKVQQSIDKKVLKKKLYFNKIEFKQKNQIKAQLYKFSSGANFDSLQKSMRENFGLEMIYDYSTNQSEKNQQRKKRTVVDYNIIDHKNNVVYNSKDLIPLKEINAKFESVISKEDLAKEILDIKSRPGTFFDTKDFFKHYNLNLDREGSIKLNSGVVVGVLDMETMDTLKYNQRLIDCSKVFHTHSINENGLASVYRVNPEDISLNPKELSQEDIARYKGVVDSYLNRNIDNPINTNDIKIYKLGTQQLLVDRKNSLVLDIKNDLNITIPEKKIKNIPKLKEQKTSVVYPSINSSVLLELIPSYLDDLNTTESNKKRKRKRQQNISR